MIIKDLIPPILIKAVKNIAGLNNTKEYQNYSQALKACNRFAYEDSELCDMIADKTMALRDSLLRKPYILNTQDVHLLAALNQCLIVHPKNNLTVLDFGGACGAHYFEMKRFIPDSVSLKWYVVEMDEMAKAAFSRNLNSEELLFVNSIEAIGTKIDFIHSSGALQCVSDPYDILKRLVGIEADFVFFSRMLLNKGNNDVITILKSYLSWNGPGKLPEGYNDRITSYPHTTMSLKKFNSFITSSDYTPEWIFEDPLTGIQLKNEKVTGKGFLFVKNAASV